MERAGPARTAPHAGARVEFSERLSCDVLESGVRGERVISSLATATSTRNSSRGPRAAAYIHRPDEAGDHDRYQAVYAEKRGSVAAPTAGLHFTPEYWPLAPRAHERSQGDLHVGLATFQPWATRT